MGIVAGRRRHTLSVAVTAPLLVAVAAVIGRYCGLAPGACYDVAWTASALTATIGTVAARRRARAENRRRWTLWAAASACWLFGQVMWDVYAYAGFPRDPNLSDAGWWGFALLFMVSVLQFPRAERSILVVAAVETVPLVCAAISLCLALLWAPAIHSTVAIVPRVSDLLYPCIYASATVLTLQAMLGGALRGLQRWSLRLVVTGTALISFAFILWCDQLLHGTYVAGTSPLDPLWVIGLGAIGIGGLMSAREPEDPPALQEPSHLGVILPAGMFTLLFVALALRAISGAPIASEEILVLGLVCSGVALVVRSTLLARRTRELLERERRALGRLKQRESELARLNEQLREDSRHDPLLGIGNRRALSEDLQMYATAQRETAEQVAVLLCDVDHFKSYNDRFGHLAGDQALSVITATARAGLRGPDAAYRFGGEELLFLLRDIDAPGALLIAERIRTTVQAAALTHPGTEAGALTVSIGLACGAESPERLLARADTALYRAKESGRNRVCVADDRSPTDLPRRERTPESEGPAPRHLRSMLTVSRAAAGGQGVLAVIEALAEAIRAELSFNVVAVNLRESATQLRVVTVLGEPSARELLLEMTTELREWEELEAVATDVHGAWWLPAGSYADDMVSWRSAKVAPLTAGGWHPDDMLLLPLRGSSGDILGIVSVDQPMHGRRASDAEVGVLMAVVDHAALALEQVQQHGAAGGEESDQLRLAAVMLLAEALDLRDPSTARHSETVGRLARRTAVELGLREDRVERVHAAGVLHDLGKLGIADAILHKPGALDDSEWREMRRHPEVGARILEHAGMRDIAGWVRAHHERIDGEGYPLGLPGDAIPLESRILSVADSYEAMIADRAYRAGMAPSAAREELLRCAGTQFDPTVVTAFLHALAAEGEAEGPARVADPGPPAAPAPLIAR
jgi:diguanylate cyclase (GGDEF)-like protein